MIIAGYIAAVLIGISLGLIGGGGSILTIPVLVYLFGVQPLTATGYSLFIVGVSSSVGAIKNYRKGLKDISKKFQEETPAAAIMVELAQQDVLKEGGLKWRKLIDKIID